MMTTQQDCKACQRASLRECGVAYRTSVAEEPTAKPPQSCEGHGQCNQKENIIKIDGYRLLLEEQGQGTYGKCLSALSPCGELVCVKIFKSRDGEQDAKYEAKIMKDLSSSDCASLFPRFISLVSSAPFPAIIMEHGGPSLKQVLSKDGPMKMLEVKLAGRQLERAAQALHACDFVHMDVKPGNVLYQAKRVKLIDFGLTEPIHPDPLELRFWEYCTPAYRAPELWVTAPSEVSKNCAPAADIWGWGHCVYEMMSGGQELFRPIKETVPVKRMVQEWCQMVSAAQCKTDGNKEIRQRLQLRLSRVGEHIGPVVKTAMQAKPGHRKMRNLLDVLPD